NQQIKAAVARFDEARATVNITRSGLFPNVSVSGSYARERTSAKAPLISTGLPIGHPTTFNEFLIPLDLSYELDIWGRVRRSLESSRAQFQATADELEVVRLAIQAEVAVDYFTLRALDSEQAVLISSVEVFNQSYELTTN